MPGKTAKIQVPDGQIEILQEIPVARTATLRPEYPVASRMVD